MTNVFCFTYFINKLKWSVIKQTSSTLKNKATISCAGSTASTHCCKDQSLMRYRFHRLLRCSTLKKEHSSAVHLPAGATWVVESEPQQMVAPIMLLIAAITQSRLFPELCNSTVAMNASTLPFLKTKTTVKASSAIKVTTGLQLEKLGSRGII